MAWGLFAALICAWSWQSGAPPIEAAAGLALALSPALLTLLLAEQAQHAASARLLIGFGWIGFGCAGLALSAGQASALAACFALAPASALAAGDRRLAGELGVFAAIGALLAAAAQHWLAASLARPIEGVLGAAAGLAVAAYWLASAPAAARTQARFGFPAGAVTVLTDAGGRIRAASRAAAERLGLIASAQDDALPLARRLAPQLSPEGQAAVAAGFAAAAAKGRGVAAVTLDAGGAAPRPLAVEVVRTAKGFSVAAADASAWAQAVADADTLRAGAQERRRLRAERTAELSHELRTPLTHILGFAEIMERELYGPLGAKYLDYVELIQRSGRNLLGLINNLMDLSRIEGGRYLMEPEAFDLRDLVSEVVRLSTTTAERRKITLEADLPDHAIDIEADPRAVRQILMNITTNALKFTPEGGRVSVAARAQAQAAEIAVSDTGPGIPEKDRARLGGAFERGEGVSGVEGVGLGLALVRAFAEAHGGTLAIGEAELGGAKVMVRLPLKHQPAPPEDA